MGYIAQHFHFAAGFDDAQVVATIKQIGQRLLITAALLAFSYGLLAAEVELAKLEGFPAAIVR